MFDSRRAQRVIQFVENLKHTKGEFHGKNFALLPWQEKIISDVFGTMRDDRPDVRQYTSAYIEIPKKQGKQLALYTKNCHTERVEADGRACSRRPRFR